MHTNVCIQVRLQKASIPGSHFQTALSLWVTVLSKRRLTTIFFCFPWPVLLAKALTLVANPNRDAVISMDVLRNL